jgi:phosphopantothenoylcysteine synthetase/decarboxylase
MNLLVTAGNTLAPIDQVRCITNIFTGRTGAAIALCGHQRGHDVILLTSHPEAVAETLDHRDQPFPTPGHRWKLHRYRTFEDLHGLMAQLIPGNLDAIVHCAAVSDYLAEGVYAPAPGTSFSRKEQRWETNDLLGPTLVSRRALKVKSDEDELWIRLVRAPKLIDLIRQPWGFRGLLVKFKLEVGISDDKLLQIAERSRSHSQADLMVANTLEDAPDHAFLGPVQGPLPGGYRRLDRRDLPEELLSTLEQLSLQRRGQTLPEGPGAEASKALRARDR